MMKSLIKYLLIIIAPIHIFAIYSMNIHANKKIRNDPIKGVVGKILSIPLTEDMNNAYFWQLKIVDKSKLEYMGSYARGMRDVEDNGKQKRIRDIIFDFKVKDKGATQVHFEKFIKNKDGVQPEEKIFPVEIE